MFRIKKIFYSFFLFRKPSKETAGFQSDSGQTLRIILSYILFLIVYGRRYLPLADNVRLFIVSVRLPSAFVLCVTSMLQRT